eukprot:515164-Lingulodinium_polyedra.AAC.1
MMRKIPPLWAAQPSHLLTRPRPLSASATVGSLVSSKDGAFPRGPAMPRVHSSAEELARPPSRPPWPSATHPS